jgi:protein associated with RNAse G/E
METIKISPRTTISKIDEKYFLSQHNEYTDSINTIELVFGENGIATVHWSSHASSSFQKEQIDVSFEIKSLFIG